MIEDEPYWDGGIVSNTPIEAVFDDPDTRNSLVFAVNLWQTTGESPQSISEATSRQKDIQFASRADNHIEDERKIQHLRKIIDELAQHLPKAAKALPEVGKMLESGCQSTMHIVRLFAPQLIDESHTKDIDFTRQGIETRWHAGYLETLKMLDASPWEAPCDKLEGVQVHTLNSIKT
jgi:NTE family protein